MAGTTLVFKKEKFVVLEKVEKKVYEEVQHKKGEEKCTCAVNESVVHLGKVSSVLWNEDEIDWEYGY
ncbi:hypothetical protein ACS46_10715 [Bacillus cereus]|nr:hypothetical protein ACS46_10715 [Bacillus cereus]